MSGGFVDALIKRLQEKGDEVGRVFSPTSSLGDRAGSAIDVALSPLELIGRVGEGAFGLSKAAGTTVNTALGGSNYGPEEVAAARAALTDPLQAVEYLHKYGTGLENITAAVANPLNTMGKGSFINEAGKSEAVGNIVKQLFTNPATRQVDTAALQAFLNNPVGKAADLVERGATLPLTAPIEGAQKLLGGVGRVTGLGQLSRGAKAAQAADASTAEVASLQQQIDAAYKDVAPEARPTPEGIHAWGQAAQGGDKAALAKLQDVEQRLIKAQTGLAPEAAAATEAASAPAARPNGPIVGQDPMARPALPGEAPAQAGLLPSEQVIQGNVAKAADQALTAAGTPALPAAKGTAEQYHQMDTIINQFQDWAEKFPGQGFDRIATRLQAGNVPAEEKHAYGLIYSVMRQGENRPVAAAAASAVDAAPQAAEAVAQKAEAALPAADQAAQAPSDTQAFVDRYNKLFPEAAITPEEAANYVVPESTSGPAPVSTNGLTHARDLGPAPAAVQDAGIADALGTALPPSEAQTARAQKAQELAQKFTDNGVTDPSRALVAREAGISPRSSEAIALHIKVKGKLAEIAAAAEPTDAALPEISTNGHIPPAAETAAPLDAAAPESRHSLSLQTAQEYLDKGLYSSAEAQARQALLSATTNDERVAAGTLLDQVRGSRTPENVPFPGDVSPGTGPMEQRAADLRSVSQGGMTKAEFAAKYDTAVAPAASEAAAPIIEQAAAPVAAKAKKGLTLYPQTDTAVDPERLAKLMKAAKRDAIDEVVDGELEQHSRLKDIAHQIKSIFPYAKTDEELTAVIQQVAAKRAGGAALGAGFGFGQDDNGNATFDPTRAGLGAAIGSVAPGNTRVVFKGEIPEQLIQLLGKRFGTSNVTRGAKNIVDLALNGRITEQALRDVVASAAKKIGLDTTDALVAHPQGSDMGILVKNADDKLRAMIQRVAPQASVTPTEDGLQVLLRQTPNGSRGTGTLAQQAAASRTLNARVAEAVKAHGLNPDEVMQAGRPRIEPLSPLAENVKSGLTFGAQTAPQESIVDRITTLFQQGGTDTTVASGLLDKKQAVTQVLEKDRQSAQDLLARIQAKVPQPITTAQDALNNSYAQRVAGDDLKQLANLRDKYGFDVLDQAQWAEHMPALTEKGVTSKYMEGIAPSALDKAAQSSAVRYGFPSAVLGTVGALSADDENKTKAAGAGAAAGLLGATPMGRALGTSLKQILLMSPRYHVNNLTDIGIKSVLNGIKPFLSDSTVAKYLDGWGQLTPEAAKQVVNLGGGMFQSFTKAGQEFYKGVRVNPSVVEGFSSELGDAPALVRFLRLEKPAQANRRIAQTFERDARLAAFIQGKEQYLSGQLSGFADKLESLSPDAAQAVRDSGGVMSLSKLSDAMDTAGVAGPQRAQALKEWGQMLSAGDQQGADLANKIHFNYRYTTNFDQFMGQLMLFHIYSTRNLVYYPHLLAEHPMVAASLVKLEQQSAEDADKRNLTSRFLGTTPAGQGVSKLASLLFGANGEVFINPAQYVSIVQQALPLAKQAHTGDSSQSAIGAAAEGMQNIGLGLNPIAQIALGGAGAMGDTVPASGVLTPLQPLTAALRGLQGAGALGPVGGSTIEADPTVGLTGGIINGLGTQVQDFSKDAIRKRIAEMAIEQGKAPGAFDAAVQDQNSPIYKEAVRQVAAQQAVKGGLSYGLANNIQFLPNSEAQIRAAREGQPKFDPNANALGRAQYGQQRQQANAAESTREVSSTAVTDTFKRTLNTDPAGVAKAALALGAEVSRAPDGSIKVAVQGTALNTTEMREVLDYYQTKGGKVGLMSQAYTGVNRDPAKLAEDKAKNKLDDQQVLANYQAASPSQKVVMLQDPNVNFVLNTQLHRKYTPPGAYR